MSNLALATDNTNETVDTDSLVYILGYAKKENARFGRLFCSFGISK